MTDTQQTKEVAALALVATKEGQVFATFRASNALEVLDIFRSVSEREQERILHFAYDATLRNDSPALTRRQEILEAFDTFVRYRDQKPELTNQELDLTPEQYDRYEQAWQAISAIYDEVEAFCAAEYREGGEKA